ncbi:MAG: type II secretion system ATPase GspE [Gammaproteobacteria bacterium]|nr:type II secretion system ATPase GspE [Gammaproteobacteria bacterium]
MAETPSRPQAVAAAVAPPPRVSRLPLAFARRHGVLLSDEAGKGLQAYVRPGVSRQALSEVRRFYGAALTFEQITPEHFDQLLQRSYQQHSSQAMQQMEEVSEEMDLSRIAGQLTEPQDLLESQDDAPIIRLINALLTEAVKENASDIHIEPYESRLVVRFRVDGVLREIIEPPRVLAPLLVSRVKVMAKLDIAEKRLPQDGRISLRIAGRPVDVRVSTLPAGHGERVVMRLLDKQAGRLDLDQLGMAREVQATADRVIHRPHGIMLVTGPTGSGKTTTLYAVLSRLNNRQRNIMTVEDPIEYYIDGVSQTQVVTRVNMTFARGLRAILRQDPDVVMVGEIRDLETAEIAVQASLTGHLVLSTLHTNSAIGAITRLRDMGIEPFLLASSLVGVLAQRLVRVLCKDCKAAYSADDSERAALGRQDRSEAVTLYRAAGCNACNHTGYRGRIGIFEMIEITDSMRTLIHENASEQQIEACARQQTSSIFQDGIRRVLAGETALEEVLRVTHEE